MALTKISSSVIAGNAVIAAGVAENAITSSEIASNAVGTAQIASGAITNAMLDTNIDIAGTLDVTGVLTADSNVVIAGNLTVNGSTVTNSATNTTIEDLLIELGTGTTGSPSSDAGIVIERGDSDNAFIGWDESADSFIVGTGSFTGASTGNLTISTAPLTTGALTASGLSYPTSDGSAGQFLKTNGSGTLSFDTVTSVVDNYTTTGDGSTTAFDTGINPGNEVNTWVFIDGVYQQKSEYSYSGSTITFSTAPDNGATIDVTTGTVGGFASSDTVLGIYEATTTDTDTYTTGISASNENNTWVFVGGVYQPKDSYTFSSGTLTFDANTPVGEKLSVVGTKTLTASAVTTSAIAANAVTSAKIASNSILSRHIANNSIVGADISATTQITASTFTGALTGNVTGNVTGNLNGLSYPSSDGTNGQVLTTNGSGTLSFSTISGYTDSDVETYLNTSTIYTDATNNRLGIGTASPSELLHLTTSSGNARLRADNGTVTTFSGIDSVNTMLIGTSTAHDVRFITSDAERMRILSSGKISAGTTSSPSGGSVNMVLAGTTAAGIQLSDTAGNGGGAILNISDSLAFYTHTGAVGSETYTERMRILSSGGIAFNGDTAAANALDDYEEGTWTPDFNIAGTATQSNAGYYTKIGNLVFVSGKVQVYGRNGTGTPTISGLPFTPSNANDDNNRNSARPEGDYVGVNTQIGNDSHFRLNGTTLQGVYNSGGSTAYQSHTQYGTNVEFNFHVTYLT